MRNILPFLISIPHSGINVPDELKDRICLSKKDLFDDSDAFTREIYDIGDWTKKIIYTGIARAFVDTSRPVDTLPPEFPDGVIKSKTCYGKFIYKKGQEPNKSLIQTLIHKYYHPYHKQIIQSINEPDIKLALDCHSMAEIAPTISPDTGSKRPWITLSNVSCRACSYEIIKILAECFQEVFKIAPSDVCLNNTFEGGYITKKYGNNPIPWIQIEISRAFYLKSPWFNKKTLTMDPQRLRELNLMFTRTLINFFDLSESIIC